MWPFHIHRWRYVYVHHYRDTSYSAQGAPSYESIKRCVWCGKTKHHYEFGGGYPTVEQLNGEG